MKILVGDIKRKRRLSLRQMEALTGISKSQLSKIISGGSSPTMQTMEDIAKGLHIHISDLYDSPYK